MSLSLKEFIINIQKKDSNYGNFGMKKLKSGKVVFYLERKKIIIYDIEQIKHINVNYPYFRILYLPNKGSKLLVPYWLKSNTFTINDAKKIVKDSNLDNIWIDNLKYHFLKINQPLSLNWKFDPKNRDITAFDENILQSKEGNKIIKALPKKTLFLLMLHQANYYLRKRYPILKNSEYNKKISYLLYTDEK